MLLCSKIHRSHQEAGTHRGKVGNHHLPKLELCPRGQTAEGSRESGDSGTSRRGSGRWRTELESPQNLGEGVYHSNQREVFKGRMLPIMSIQRTVSQNVVLRTPTLESLRAGRNSVGADNAYFRTSAIGTRTEPFNRHSGVLPLQPLEFCCP